MGPFDELTVAIDEMQRQMLLLALAKLSIERPGWHTTLGELAAKYSTMPDLEDGRALFEQFRTIHLANRRQAITTVDPTCDEGCPVHVRYIDEHGETWDHGYATLDDLDLQREIRQWLAPSPWKAPPARPIAGRPLAWKDQTRGLPRKE